MRLSLAMPYGKITSTLKCSSSVKVYYLKIGDLSCTLQQLELLFHIYDALMNCLCPQIITKHVKLSEYEH